MKTIEAIFIAFGDSPDVLALASGTLEGVVQQRLAIGDNNPATNDPAISNSVIIKLPLSPSDDATAIRDTRHWLENNRAIIGSTGSKKILEFHTFLDSDIGSRILTVPNSIVRICGDLGIDIASQAIRVLTNSKG
jgi:hypothetical protein